MDNSREPRVHPVKIADLRPTQITLGMREVKAKRKRWRVQKLDTQEKFLGSHLIPVVRGPKHALYVIDHHHLCRALHEEGEENILVTVAADLSRLEKEAFWIFLDNSGWLHPFDANGKRCNYSKIPKAISEMQDDPYRSLAGALRLAGGYAKESKPFSEFLWADYLRPLISKKIIETDFNDALDQGLKHAKSSEADHLPGWSGPSSDS